MKTRFIVLFLIGAGVVFAHPTINYSYGLLRTISADNGSAGHIHIGIFARYFTETRDVTTLGEQTGEANHKGYDSYFGLGYAFTDNIAINVSSSIHGDALDYGAPTDLVRISSGMGDTKIGLKLSVGGEKVKFGLNPFVSFMTGSDVETTVSDGSDLIFGDGQTNKGGIFRYHSSGATDMGVIGLITIKGRAFALDLNLGYVDKNKNDDALGWKNNYTIYRAALSYDLGAVVPFIELGGIDYIGKDELFTFIDDDSVFGPNQVYITPGLGFRFGGFNLDLAVDIRGWEGENERAFPTTMTDSFNITTGWGVTPPWAAVVGISYCADFMPDTPTTSLIAGMVYDRNTDKPLMANIALYGENNAMIASAASDEDGAYQFKKVAPDLYSIGAQAPGYVDNKINIAVKAGETTPLDIPLTPDKGTLIILIQEIEGDVPQSAEVTIGSMTPEIVTGKAEKVLKSGTYMITATAMDKGYLPFTKEVAIEPGGTIELLITLVKEEFKIVLPEVYFETAKSEIKPESYKVLDEAAETIIKIIDGNPSAKIEIQGHTDSRGDNDYNMQLSNDRAAAVKNYLVSKHNINAERLVAKGYGESKPTTSNASEDGMAKNRRVEFVIIK